MNKKIFLLTLMLFFSFTFITAQPPFETTNSGEGIQIFYPQIAELKANTNFTAHIHVLNLSNNNMELPNTAYTCNSHIYDAQGSHIYESPNWNLDSNGREQEFIFTGGNFTEEGLYNSFYIYCNTSNTADAVKGSYLITGNGAVAPSGIVIVGFSIIFLLILMGSVTYFIKIMGHLANKDADLLDIGIAWGLYFGLLGLNRLADIYLGNTELMNWFNNFVVWFGFPMILIPILAFVISIFVTKKEKKKQSLQW